MLAKENSNHRELTISSEPGGGKGYKLTSLLEIFTVSVSTFRLFSFTATQASALCFEIIAITVYKMS